MGQISVEISQPTGSLLSGNQQPIWKFGGWGALGAAAYLFMVGTSIANGGWIAMALAAAGVWMLFRSSSSASEMQTAYQQAVRDVEERIKHLQSTSPIIQVVRKKAEALDAIAEAKLLSTAFANVRNDYDKHRRQKQLDDYLAKHPIRGARISKVNSGDVASLASYGFTTAFDARQRDVQQVHGIGPVKGGNIMAWVRRLEAKFQFQAAYTPEDQRNIQQAQNKIITQQQGLEERIKKAIEAFRIEAQAFERWKSSRDGELIRLTQRLAQAEADLVHAGGAVTIRPNVAPTPVPDANSFQRGMRAGNSNYLSGGNASIRGSARKPTPVNRQTPAGIPSCPSCGSRMVLRMARRGRNAGSTFWGCTKYPRCSGTRSI